MFNNKKGFTLAEVLITLGVVGVISAMTLSSVINHYQKQATVNKLKKFYTNMNQVLMQAKADNGDFSTWSYETSEEFYNNYVIGSVVGTVNDGVEVLTGDGILKLMIVKPEGKGEMKATDWFNGIKDKRAKL